MSKAKNKPGIHLMVSENTVRVVNKKVKPMFYWHIVSKNGRIIARSSETYSSKRAAVKSIKTTGQAFWDICTENWASYYDHSKPESPLNSYL